jgi:hypothetical protein
VLVAMPAGHALPPLLPFRSEVTSRRASLGATRSENLWVPNLVNMADEITTPVLNPELVSRYDGLYETGRCHAADTRQKTTMHGVLFALLVSVDAESRDCRLRLKCDGTGAETRFRLSAKRTSPFKSAGASVQSTTGSRGVRISGINAGYTKFRGSVKDTGYPLHSPVSPSLPLPCVTVCHHISTGLYFHEFDTNVPVFI